MIDIHITNEMDRMFIETVDFLESIVEPMSSRPVSYQRPIVSIDQIGKLNAVIHVSMIHS